jgi:hypothetical protein
MCRVRWAAGIAAVLTMAACTSSTPAARSTPAASTPAASTPRTPASTPASTQAPDPKPPPAPKAALSHFRAADGSLVILARFKGPVQYRLHSGSSDPGAAALSVVRAGPRIHGSERRHLLAAFNGGFLLSAGDGGYEQEGHVISRLRHGLASLVIDRSGTAHVGAWGSGLPQPHEAVYSVRQNLRLLVTNGHPARAAANPAVWGATLGGGDYVARSALGENAKGELIYAAGMSTVPADLAAALVHAGAVTGMELDINPEWVQLDVAKAPGHGLRAAIPGQNRPAGQYLAGWTRDFITVLGP